MPIELEHSVVKAKDKEDALRQFYKELRKHNGVRRKDPEEYVKVIRITRDRSLRTENGVYGEGFASPYRVHYTIPCGLIRGISVKK